MRQLGPYQLLRRIGHGGMAEVWSAKRSAGIGGVDKYVAIKLLAPHLAEQASYREMFLAEARLSMMLTHSNIVQVFDAIEDPPDCYMVMELVEGMTLSELERSLGKQGEKIPLDVGAYVVGELLRALAYAHAISIEAGSIIVHRDVSPQNVMVTTSGDVKLMDFGIARFASEETQGVLVKGKLQYMPPEQLRMETRKPTVDLFAVGAILHELIDGRRFRGKVDQTRLLGMVLQGEIPPLQTLDSVPIEIDRLRLALLEPDEGLRIQSAKEALQLLQSWPGYRHAALDLEALVQRFVAPSSAICMLEEYEYEEVDLDSKPIDPSSDSGPSAPRASSSESAMRYVDPVAAAQTSEAGVVETEEDPFEPISTIVDPRPIAVRRWVWAIAVLLAGVGIGAVAFTMATRNEATPAPVEPPDEPVAPIEASPPPVEVPAEPELIAEDPEPSNEAPRVLVWVEFVTKEFASAQVRVNGRILDLEPKTRVRLPVGSFNVYLRTGKHDDWIKAGRITLETGHQYRVEMLRPAVLKISGRPE